MNDMAKTANKVTEENFLKLKEKLRELFQLDRGDLDFGLYRIMAHKSAEVGEFLEQRLLPQVAEALGEIANADSETAQRKLHKAILQAESLGGIDPEQTDVVRNARVELAAVKADQQIEADTYNHLYNFFSRYYDEGDFMSLRRYKGAGREAYSIPYNGEEVKLHWANADQYYIKTTENYSSYVFVPGEDKLRVRFEVVKADNEKDNIKEANDKQRFFVLSEDFIAEEKKQLIVRFEHRPLTEGEKKKHPQNGTRPQTPINRESGQRIFGKLGKLQGDWQRLLSSPCPTEADPERTLLDKHIAVYTAKNSFDYFIHKDLGGFLRRELDTYIKGEVISVDNLELTDDPTVFIRGLAQVKAIRAVGHKIIDFLAQLENFQKQLWLKKKFVLETQYCVTLDKVPESLYPAIAKNKAQRDEWVKLFAIDELKGARTDSPTAYSKPLKPEFLQENPYLVLDTRHFDQKFTDKLLASLSETGAIEEQMNGLLMHGENFQGLHLLQERYRGQINCVYIDPPYNAKSSQILYKNDYKHSSWLSLMENRLSIGKGLMSPDGVTVIAIDEIEQERLGKLIPEIFPNYSKTCITVVHNPTGQQGTNFSHTNEFAYFIYPDKSRMIGIEDRTESPDIRPLRDVSTGSHLRTDAATCFYPIYIKKGKIQGFGPVCDKEFHPNSKNIIRDDGVIEVYPIDSSGVERKWIFARDSVESITDELSVKYDKKTKQSDIIRTKSHFTYNTVWIGSQYSANSHGSVILKGMIPANDFGYPKSINTVRNSVDASLKNKPSGTVLDYFAGSGTTGHAVINLNRKDNGNRKYVLVEIGHHFENIMLPRMKKVVCSEKWKDGKPKDRNGISQLFKYVRLESYEDTLDSLAVKSRKDLFTEEESKGIVEDYQLRYALGEETADSASLVGQDFIDPFNYTLSVVRDGVRRDVNVDLAETFNFLLGLSLTSRRQVDGVLTIIGTTRKGENCLILWRNLNKMDASQLDKWFTRYREIFGNNLNLIYVNGDHTLNALRKSGDQWEAITTEPVFRELMFSGAE
ncbi:MAG: site-specific DNA-methyltransferase [Gammaproteobacteria bacterium]|nr:site-specific DNA-methyltransferase [Gammaproteobacteria bacterium]